MYSNIHNIKDICINVLRQQKRNIYIPKKHNSKS